MEKRFKVESKRKLRFLTLLFLCLLTFGCDRNTEIQPKKNETKLPSQNDRWTRERQLLVQSFLSGRDRITNPKVIEAMAATPRHEFVPVHERDHAYEDRPLPIGYGQTISQPFIVAFMTEQLQPQSGEKILEIGTGSGYQAAVLSGLVKEIYTIEIIEPLAEAAQETFGRLGYQNIFVKSGDGYKGWPEHAPFDAIIVTCAPESIPLPLVEQLKEGGRMIIPVGPDGGHQDLYLLEKKDGEVLQKAILPVRFVPMTGSGANGGE